MRESYRKGVANHPGPEPCEGGREAALEALDRGIYRLGMELRKRKCGRPTVSPQPEGNKAACDKRKCAALLRSRRPQACIETPRARTERPSCRPSSEDGGPVGESDER
jgi:hypothetical protein